MVDDYPANLVALGAVLSDPVYNLIEAHSGPAALKALEDNDVALVLLDIQMPGMDGYEVAQKIRANPKTQSIPIIFLTAHYREDPAVRKGYEVGGQDYLGKPFDPEVLKAKVAVYSNLFLKTVLLEGEKRSLRQSEERYRQIIDSAREIIAAIDNDGIITSLNLSFEKLTGHKCDAWVGKSFLPLVEPQDSANFLVHLRGQSRLETAPLFHINLRDANGRPVPVEVSVSPLKRDTETIGAVGILRDVSHRAP